MSNRQIIVTILGHNKNIFLFNSSRSKKLNQFDVVQNVTVNLKSHKLIRNTNAENLLVWFDVLNRPQQLNLLK